MISWLLSLCIPGKPILEYMCRKCGCDIYRDMDGIYCGTCGERYRDHEDEEWV